MLELRPNCECCNADLPGDSPDALICSFECTFCRTCADTRLHGRCPTRVGQALANNPASTLRVVKPHPACA